MSNIAKWEKALQSTNKAIATLEALVPDYCEKVGREKYGDKFSFHLHTFVIRCEDPKAKELIAVTRRFLPRLYQNRRGMEKIIEKLKHDLDVTDHAKKIDNIADKLMDLILETEFPKQPHPSSKDE